MDKAPLQVVDGKRIVELKWTESSFLRLCCQDIPYRDIANKWAKASAP